MILSCPGKLVAVTNTLRQPHQTLNDLFNNMNIYCTGHNGPVRSIFVQDSEHCFLSASKDKTVKLWSLSNHGDGTAQSASSWTYVRHTRPVFHVNMVESVRQGISCDGSLHVSHDSLFLFFFAPRIVLLMLKNLPVSVCFCECFESMFCSFQCTRIAHFRVTLGLFFKTRPGAQPFL